MRNVLFLVHRIPYPPDKGDKIRSYHLLKYLCKEYRVFLGTSSMELPVIATPEALRGLSGDLPDSVIAARTVEEFRQRICERFGHPNLRLNESGRRYVKTKYDWEVNLGEFGRMFGANQYSQPILTERVGGVAGQ
jgi:hypothetical protein